MGLKALALSTPTLLACAAGSPFSKKGDGLGFGHLGGRWWWEVRVKVLEGEPSGAGGWSSAGVWGNVPRKDSKGVGLGEAQGPGVRQ